MICYCQFSRVRHSQCTAKLVMPDFFYLTSFLLSVLRQYQFKTNERILSFFDNFDKSMSEERMWEISESIKPRGRAQKDVSSDVRAPSGRLWYYRCRRPPTDGRPPSAVLSAIRTVERGRRRRRRVSCLYAHVSSQFWAGRASPGPRPRYTILITARDC